VETALDELYTAAPPGFVARREELAAAARAAGRVEEARLIHAARRPTLAAWAANLLLRSRPQESGRFLELGQALRGAYRTLDSDGVRKLTEQSRGVVAALSRQAAQLARDAGHPLSHTAQQDVENTLRAVLADQGAAGQWATGRLESALTPPSTFPSPAAPAVGAARKASRSTSSAPPSSPSPPSRASARARAKDELAERRRRRQEDIAQAEEAAKAAEQRLRDQRAAQADADARLRQAHDRHDQARQEVLAAEQRLEQARQELQRAEREQREAEDRRRAAADTLAQAEQTARVAAQKVRRLGSVR
jgi:DNA repair exonuclease SbcCD ATPase subunit